MDNKYREILLQRIRKRIEKHGSPRVIVSFILLFSSGFGVLCSFILLHTGLETLWFRYLISMGAGYASFFVGVKIWLTWIRRHKQSIGIDLNPIDTINIIGGDFSTSPLGVDNSFSPGGGKFGGGGSHGSWEASSVSTSSPSPSSSSSSSITSGGGKGGFGLDIDLDELIAVIFFIAAVLVFLCALLYVIYIAPALLTELIVDSMLIGGAYKKVHSVDPNIWIETTLKRTIIPFIVTIIMFVIAGILIQRADPEAKSIGEFFRHIVTETPSAE